MSTTGEAADVHGSCQPDPTKCSECDSEPSSAVIFCLSCKAPLCAPCDEDKVHTSRTTRNHVRVNNDGYLMMKRGLGGSSPTDDEMAADNENKFCFVSPIDYRIWMLPRLATLVADPNAQPSLVAFVGPTGVGKSTLIRLLVTLDGETRAGNMPLAGASNDAQSTSADIHMYAGGQVRAQSAVDSTYPLIYVDSEGRGGSQEPRAIRSLCKIIDSHFSGILGNYEGFKRQRIRHVQVSYPRMLYIFSDVLCFVFSGDWRERESIVKPLLEWGRSAAAGAANLYRPHLILIFNKMGPEAVYRECDDFRKMYDKWIQGCDPGSRDELQLLYSDPLVILIPQFDINSATMIDRVRNLRQEIHESTMRIRTFRKQANQLLTRRQLQSLMERAAKSFTRNSHEEFDIYKASMDQRPPSAGLAYYIVEFFRAVEQENEESTSKSKRHQISLDVLRMRVQLSVLLWIGRVNVNVAVGANAQLHKDLQRDLEEAQNQIDGFQPCASETQVCGRSYRCDTVRGMHAGNPHVSAQIVRGKSERWDGVFTPYPEVKRAEQSCRLINLAERALREATALNVKVIRGRLSEVRKLEHAKYQWLKYFSCYRVCVSCMTELPTEVLSCGHIICAMCAKEEAQTLSNNLIVNLTCPVCLSSAKWYPKDLPPLAGYRILSLDGGGVRGIVELLSLQEIMSFFPGMHVEDLFDIIVGTSTGGIIALALTVHEPNKQPKRLPNVIRLFLDLCKQVFSREMTRIGANFNIILRSCQFLRVYDTKYRNDNLLRLLEEHLGSRSLLQSCVGGPHVIVTSCDRDNDLAAAWFTSYNRPMKENDSSDLLRHAHVYKEEQRSPKLLFGRVHDNHLFSAREVGAATSAAGTYFPAYEAGGRFWVDGGLRLNCPVGIAIQEARTLWPERLPSAIISLGCGDLSYEQEAQPSNSLMYYFNRIVDIVSDAHTQCKDAIGQLQPDSQARSLRLNPTIVVPKGKKCELDSPEEMQFLIDETKSYLANDGYAYVQKGANLLYAALFYVHVEIDGDLFVRKLDMLHIRSRAALPPGFKDAFIAARRSSSPPFSVTVYEAPGAECKFLWEQCTWVQGIMDLPFTLGGFPAVGPLTVMVKLHMCVPGTTAPPEWSLPISGMPCSFDQ